jgi:hypothetical protein
LLNQNKLGEYSKYLGSKKLMTDDEAKSILQIPNIEEEYDNL